MEKKDYIIGIDIGSSNVVMAVGERNIEGEISILGVEVQPINDCVVDGDVTNYIELGKAIKEVKANLEKELNCSLKSAYIGFSGKSVYCVRYEDYVEINEKVGCVTEADLHELNTRIQMAVPGGGDEIVERILLRYNVDDRQEVKNPIGAYGRKLSATYLFVMAGKMQINAVNRAMHYAEIQVCGLCVNPTLMPQVLLNEVEREEGVAVVDIGANLTDISIVRGGKLWYFSSLPIGASSINNDLYEFLKVPRADIDILKRKYGSAVAEYVEGDKSVPVKIAGRAKKQILLRNIAEITEERLKDIARFVLREIKAAMFLSKVPCGVVLTGGTVHLDNIDKLFARELQMEVRRGELLNGLDDESQERVPAFQYAAVVGLLLYGAKHQVCEAVSFGEVNTPTPTPTPTLPTPVQPVEEQPINEIFSGEDNTQPQGDADVVVDSGESEELKPVDLNNPTNPTELQPIEESNDDHEEESNREDGKHKDAGKSGKNSNGSDKPKGGWMRKIRVWLDEVFESDDEL